ncbi:MAG: beta strand repeat-containing protein, partial [Planctomycetota bacterium]
MNRNRGWICLAIVATILAGGFFVHEAKAQATVNLTRGTPVTVTQTNTPYNMSIEQGFWNVVGIGAPASTDWDITHAGVTSALGAPWTDYVLADGRAGSLTGNAGVVSIWGTGTAPGTLVHADHGPALTVNQSGGGNGTYTFLNTDIMYFWEVNVTQAGNYDFSVTGNTAMYYDIWASVATTWTNCANPLVFQNMGTPTNNLTLSAGWHCVVVYSNGGPGTTANINLSVQPSQTTTPSFVAQSISVVGTPPVTVTAGGTFQATRAIQNTGNTAGTTTYSIYLSTDQTITTADTLVYSGTTQSIPSGGTDTQTDTCTVPGATASGSYFVGLYIAAGNTAVTTNQDVIVQGGGSANLVATTISVGGAPVSVPSTGGTFQATRAIRNSGSAAGSTAYAIYLSTDQTITTADIQVFSGTTASIAAGATDTQTDTCTVPNGTTAGPYYVGLYIAAGNTAVTTNQDVTVTASTFNPLAQSITTIGAPVSIPSAGGSFQVNRAIQNAGGVAGTTPYSIYLSTDQSYDAADISVYSGTTASIAAGATDTVTDTCTVAAATTPGNYYVILYIAAGNEVSTTGQDVTVLAPFAASASAISVPAAPVNISSAVGGTFLASRSIQNTGGDPGTTTYEIYISTDATIDQTDTLVFSGVTAQIAGGVTDTQTDTCLVPAGLTAGTSYYVGLYIAAGNTAVTANQDVNITDFNPIATSLSPLNSPVRTPAGTT